MASIEEAIYHFKYGVSHDIFSEPVTTYAKMAISALREQAEWIPVTERLPEDGERVLVCTQTHKIKDARYIKRSGRFVTAGNITVTHWKPMPALPEGVQKEVL